MNSEKQIRMSTLNFRIKNKFFLYYLIFIDSQLEEKMSLMVDTSRHISATKKKILSRFQFLENSEIVNAIKHSTIKR